MPCSEAQFQLGSLVLLANITTESNLVDQCALHKLSMQVSQCVPEGVSDTNLSGDVGH